MRRTTGALQRLAPRLLWLDGLAAASAGLLVLGFSQGLSSLYGLPVPLLQFLAVVNLLYGSYSLGLACWPRRPRACILLLVLANTIWAGFCVRLALQQSGTASAFGLAHLLGEALFVGTLAALEWRYRKLLAPASQGRKAST